MSKAIDKAAGAEREVVGYDPTKARPNKENFAKRTDRQPGEAAAEGWKDNGATVTAPATSEAETWQGWGTALKPATEPILVARKPLVGTVAANVLEHGTGALNIDGCRVAFASADDEDESKTKNRHADFGSGPLANQVYGVFDKDRADSGNYDPPGRWPANVVLVHADECRQVGIKQVDSNGHFPSERPGGVRVGTVGHAGQQDLDERSTRGETVEVWECVAGCPIDQLDRQAGDLGVSAGGRINKAPGSADVVYGGGWQAAIAGDPGYGDSGGPSRFFYSAKTSRAERNAGLDDFEKRPMLWSSGEQNPGSFQAEGTEKEARNNHPTVKPVDVMRWLVRLVTPPGGTVLDPFMGSGTTGIACVLEGFEFVGVEQDADYARIAEARIAFWTEHGEDTLRIVAARETAQRVRDEIAESGQLDMLSGV